MIPALRQAFNQTFSQEKYQQMLSELGDFLGGPIPFRVGESPVFIPDDLQAHLQKACEEILESLAEPDFLASTQRAIPPEWQVPGPEGLPSTIALDFGLSLDDNARPFPYLIELQGFPSLYAYQYYLPQFFAKTYPFLEEGGLSPYGEGFGAENYPELLRQFLLGEHAPENVVLLEIEPRKQKTWPDFLATEKLAGIRPLCLSELRKRGNKLYYREAGREIPIHRIYNRVIFDELAQRSDLPRDYYFNQEVEVEWTCHPHWFYRISKFSLPLLDSPYVPPTFFLHQLDEYPADLENYVLKPLFSFAGSGVVFDLTRQTLDQIQDPENFILQRKINYEPLLPTPDGERSKIELRMMALQLPEWPEPQVVTNLARLSKGKMMGVDYNKDRSWVGGSVALFRKSS